jgi:hypothetical protein
MTSDCQRRLDLRIPSGLSVVIRAPIRDGDRVAIIVAVAERTETTPEGVEEADEE